MENSAEIVSQTPEHKTETITQEDSSEAVNRAIPVKPDDKEEEIARVTQMLQAEGHLQPGQHIELMDSTTRDLTTSEAKKNLKATGIVKPWYKRIANPIKFFRDLFGKEKYEIKEAKEQTTQYQIIDKTNPTSGAKSSLPKAA